MYYTFFFRKEIALSGQVLISLGGFFYFRVWSFPGSVNTIYICNDISKINFFRDHGIIAIASDVWIVLVCWIVWQTMMALTVASIARIVMQSNLDPKLDLQMLTTKLLVSYVIYNTLYNYTHKIIKFCMQIWMLNVLKLANLVKIFHIWGFFHAKLKH